MSEKLKEAVSAAIDDEADEFELRRVLDEVHKDPDLKQAWERYHLVGAVLRKEHQAADAALRERVWAELDMAADAGVPVVLSEAARSAPKSSGSLLNRLTGVAVAATVALAVALIGINLTDNASTSSPVVADLQSARQSAPAPATLTAEATTPGVVTDRDQARTAALMLAHAQNLGMNQSGLAAFTKMVTYQSR
jgi:sigma-E factor negative regulatory protein RseA